MRSSKRRSTRRHRQTDKSAAGLLLDWYDRHARALPWRVGPKARREGMRPDPYHVWLSEVMLQQTQVATVRDYFHDFVSRWPTVGDLAAAAEEDVLKAWAGLGYYRRARNLKRCAETVARAHGGIFPANTAQLRELPGIGDYTAAAIAAIAFEKPVAAVDGNVERVVSRLFALSTPPRRAKAETRSLTERMLPRERSGDFAQAIMDLGATICTPRRPSCMACPLAGGCAAHAAGSPEAWPVREARAEKPLRRGAAFVVADARGAVFIRRRPETGLLAGMSEVPTSAWSASGDGETGPAAAPFPGDWREAGTVRHVFTHFALDLTVWRCDVTTRPAIDPGMGGWWSPSGELASEALPTVMKKAIEAAIPGATKQPVAAGPLQEKAGT